jgi:hypothetical protein
MAIAKSQISEVYDVIKEYLDVLLIRMLLTDLESTEAYRKNKSFKEIVDRLLNENVAAFFNARKKEKEKK